MRKLFQSLFRITSAVIVVTTALGLALGWALRQPNLGAVPYSAALHADPGNTAVHLANDPRH